MTNTIFIYALKCPDTLRVRYVGKATNLSTRFTAHLSEAKRRAHTHKNHWLNGLLASGKKPILEILDITTDTEWRECERFYIRKHKPSGLLTNTTDGGDGSAGVKQSAETISKRVAKTTGQKRTPEQRAKMSVIAKTASTVSICAARQMQKRCKKVHRFDTTGAYLDSYHSVSAMCRKFGWDRFTLYSVLGGRRGAKSHVGFQFKYAEYDNAGIEREPCCSGLFRAKKQYKRTPEQRARASRAAKASLTPARLAALTFGHKKQASTL